MENIIYLDAFLTRKKQNVLANALMGQIARDECTINELVKKYSYVRIIVPEKIMSVQASFLQGFLQDIILDIAHKKITSRIIFECQGLYDIERDLHETVSRVLREAHMI